MKRFTKITVLLVFAVVTFMVLSACGNSQGGSQTASGQARTAGELIQRYGPYANEEYNFNGFNMVMFFPWDRNPPRGEVAEVDRFLERLEYFQSKWNFTLEFREIGWDNYIARYITTTMAGDPMGHLGYIISRDIYPSFITAGIAAPLSNLGIFDKHVPEYPPLLVESTMFNGAMYGVWDNWGFNYGGMPNNATGLFYNKTMLTREGLSTPYELYNRGQWNWDTMLDLATRATRDIDGDGSTDQWGLTGRYHGMAFVDSNGGSIIRESGGRFNFGLLEPQSLEALAYFSNASALPIWEPGTAWNAPMTSFRDGLVAMTITQWWIAGDYLGSGQMVDEWGWAPMPRRAGATHERTLFTDEEAFLFSPSSVPANELRMAAIIWEAISKDPAYHPDDYFFSIETLLRNRETIEMLTVGRDEYAVHLDPFKGFGLEGLVQGAIGRVGAEATALSVMQGIESQVYANIEDRMLGVNVGNARRTVARAEAEVRMAVFAQIIEGGEAVANAAEVRVAISNAQEALDAARAEGFTEEDIAAFNGYANMQIVIETLRNL
jgi:multiple sugar transport system substrate-binding protein